MPHRLDLPGPEHEHRADRRVEFPGRWDSSRHHVAITSYDAATDQVVIAIPAARAAVGKWFGRLHVEVP